jgi:hypothetical protein
MPDGRSEHEDGPPYEVAHPRVRRLHLLPDFLANEQAPHPRSANDAQPALSDTCTGNPWDVLGHHSGSICPEQIAHSGAVVLAQDDIAVGGSTDD